MIRPVPANDVRLALLGAGFAHAGGTRLPVGPVTASGFFVYEANEAGIVMVVYLCMPGDDAGKREPALADMERVLRERLSLVMGGRTDELISNRGTVIMIQPVPAGRR